MNLSDFNRYAEDFEKKRKIIVGSRRGGASVFPDFDANLLRSSPLLAALSQADQQQMAVGSTAVASSAVMPDLAMNGFGEFGPFLAKGRNDE